MGKVRLTPPPRIEANRPVAPATAWKPHRSEASSQGSTFLRWLTLLAFLLLTVAAVAVFVILPDWAEQRRAQRATDLAALSAPNVGEGLAPSLPRPEPHTPSTGHTSSTDYRSSGAEPPDGRGQAPPLHLDRGPEIHPDREPEIHPDRGPGAQPQAPKPQTVTPAPPPAPTPPPEPTIDPAFVTAMSDGLAALDREDFAAARQAFEQAHEISSEAPQVLDGLARADAGLRLQQIADHHQKATQLEQSEQWRVALAHYEAVLELDPTVRFAQEGQDRARERAEILESLERHVANPDRLSTEAVLQEAALLRARAAELEGTGQRHGRLTADLGRLVEAYSTPVRARLQSDQQTEVMVYKVGRLGAFDERTLNLRPGTYTVVGSRRGYRDVRRRLIIEPGKAPDPLLVRCEEKI